MSKKRIIDKALSIIDDNYKLDHSEIARKIYVETGYCDQDYNKFLSVVSNGSITLRDYIRKRRLYFAALDMISNPDKSLADIAQEYGYSDQSAFSRAVKREYGKSPAELRKNKHEIPNNRTIIEGYLSKNCRLDEVLNKMISDYQLSHEEWSYFEAFTYATEECGFNVSTCCLISELSEKLDVPFGLLINKCFDLMFDIHSDPDYVPSYIEYAIDLGIKSDKELDALCDYYNCKYYELKEWQVEEYRSTHPSED